jgi:hypothetical protein
MYVEGDIVVLRVEDTNQIGIVTAVNKIKNRIAGYSVRSEKGSGYYLCSVDNPKSSWSIDSTLTRSYQESSSRTNLLYDKRMRAHTRANYNSDLFPLNEDTQWENCGDYSFPVVGARSF